MHLGSVPRPKCIPRPFRDLFKYYTIPGSISLAEVLFSSQFYDTCFSKLFKTLLYRVDLEDFIGYFTKSR